MKNPCVCYLLRHLDCKPFGDLHSTECTLLVYHEVLVNCVSKRVIFTLCLIFWFFKSVVSLSVCLSAFQKGAVECILPIFKKNKPFSPGFGFSR